VTLAKGYGLVGDEKKAEATLKAAIEADPGRLQTYSLLGRLYASQGRLDEAQRQLEGRLQRDPSSIGTLTMVGMLHEARGQSQDAEKSYLHALSINPRAAVSANNLAWLYVASNRNLDEAMRLAQIAAEQLPGEPAVNDTLGWIFLKKATGGKPRSNWSGRWRFSRKSKAATTRRRRSRLLVARRRHRHDAAAAPASLHRLAGERQHCLGANRRQHPPRHKRAQPGVRRNRVVLCRQTRGA
jgi:Tfp pilus assembly protein PilF